MVALHMRAYHAPGIYAAASLVADTHTHTTTLYHN